jgi:hypothetical protein
MKRQWYKKSRNQAEPGPGKQVMKKQVSFTIIALSFLQFFTSGCNQLKNLNNFALANENFIRSLIEQKFIVVKQ